jgi:hypothetical protein
MGPTKASPKLTPYGRSEFRCLAWCSTSGLILALEKLWWPAGGNRISVALMPNSGKEPHPS